MLNEDHDKEIVAAIRMVPTNPTQTLFSRRRQAVEIGGDAIVFPLEPETTNPDFVSAIKSAQQRIYSLIETDFGISGKTWSDKASRHQEKLYKRHKKLHLAFAGTIAPSAREEYLAIKQQHSSQMLASAQTVLKEYLNQTTALSAKVRECKLNADGHIVVRMDINDGTGLLNCREQLARIFGNNYSRHTDPEKQKTLAAVITVVDYEKLSVSAKTNLTQLINQLENDLKEIGTIFFSKIEWIDYSKRTLSEKSRLGVIHIQRDAPAMCSTPRI